MDTGKTIAIAAGCGVGVGMLALVLGLFSRPEPIPTAAKPINEGLWQRFLDFFLPASGQHATQKRQALVVVILIVGVGVWLITRVVVFGVTAGVFVALLPTLVLPDRSRKEKLRQLRALDAWIRGIAARMRSGISLDQALSVSIRDVDAIAPQLQRLSATIAAGVPTSVAVRAFAGEMNDGTFDFACQKLILVSGRSVDGLADALDSLAAAVAKRVEARQAIEVDRAKPQATARSVVFLGLAMIGGFPLIERNFMTPYRTFVGQIVFAVLMALGILCLLWAKSIARMDPEPRIFGDKAARSPADEDDGFFGIGGRK